MSSRHCHNPTLPSTVGREALARLENGRPPRPRLESLRRSARATGGWGRYTIPDGGRPATRLDGAADLAGPVRRGRLSAQLRVGAALLAAAQAASTPEEDQRVAAHQPDGSRPTEWNHPTSLSRARGKSRTAIVNVSQMAKFDGSALYKAVNR